MDVIGGTIHCTRCGARAGDLERCPSCGAVNRYRDCPLPEHVRRERGLGSAIAPPPEREGPPGHRARPVPAEPVDATEDVRDELDGSLESAEGIDPGAVVDTTEEMTEARRAARASREGSEPFEGDEDAPTVRR